MSSETTALSVVYMDRFHNELSPEDFALLRHDNDLELHITAAACILVALKFSGPDEGNRVFGLLQVCQCFPTVSVRA